MIYARIIGVISLLLSLIPTFPSLKLAFILNLFKCLLAADCDTHTLAHGRHTGHLITMSLSLNPSNQHQHQHQPVPPSVSCETLEAECNVLGMELLNVLEYIGDSVDYRQITLLIQKLSNSMDFITSSVNKLRNVTTRPGDLEEQLKEKKEELGRLQNKLKQYSEQ